MEIYCADCGCLVDDGVRVIPCGSPGCCCLHLPAAASMEVVAARIRTAFNALDMDAFRSLLAEDARWGEDPDSPQTCHNRADVLAWYGGLIDRGFRASVVATAVELDRIVLTLDVTRPGGGTSRNHQVFRIASGHVVDIRDHQEGPAGHH